MALPLPWCIWLLVLLCRHYISEAAFDPVQRLLVLIE
jgi:hypothetical protein